MTTSSAAWCRQGKPPRLAALAHSVHVELPGLEPDRWYHYRFMVGDAVSTAGRTRTFPAPGCPLSRRCGWPMPLASTGSTVTTAPTATCWPKTWMR
ncbi:MAG: PhoD-like phosphatase N-terminal domain-containing protein [Rhodoferax sp.]|nr:PhoD-like phosphatase N-terminal domain-containing protein [Rhodoferax sp.]